jgi:uncharacterized protein (DUF433 family)
MAPQGTYTADRTAALSGVPKSTVHYWAREGILTPSASPERIKLWSYADLLGLRTIYWLRHNKVSATGQTVPKTSMPQVRKALAELREVTELFACDEPQGVAVDRVGRIVVLKEGRATEASDGQGLLDGDLLDLTGPFSADSGILGPDLQHPRPHLRILPGKLGGSPHVEDTRVETEALGALAARGLPEAKIYRLYPAVEQVGVDEALDLERQLSRNLAAAA